MSLALTVAAAISACTLAPSAPPVARTVTPPALNAAAPAEYPGLHNVVAYADGFYSGSAPDDAAGFATLRAMGIRTIISVDGATPDVAAAQAQGLRYVHLPIGYNGMDKERTLEIASAVHDLPGPVYIHCHHGKHRSAGAAGAVAVTLGTSSVQAALYRMKVSGTAPNYTGLFACVKDASPATPADLAAADHTFPATYRTTGFVKGMVEIDELFDQLKLVEKANWKTPAEHPDLVPAALAAALGDHFRILAETEKAKAKPAEFHTWMLAADKQATTLEEAILAAKSPADLSNQFKLVAASCTQCHAKYRD